MKNYFYGSGLLFGIFTIFSMIRFIVYQHKLMRYLLEKHTEKWKELTTFLGYGPGCANSFKGLPFLFRKEYLGDPEVLRLKVIVRNSFIYVLGGMVTTVFMFFVMVCIYPESRG